VSRLERHLGSPCLLICIGISVGLAKAFRWFGFTQKHKGGIRIPVCSDVGYLHPGAMTGLKHSDSVWAGQERGLPRLWSEGIRPSGQSVVET
jgi:hypothetical protein